MAYIKIGRIVNAIGIKGEVKIYNYSDEGRFNDIDKIYIENKRKKGEDRYELYRVQSARTIKNTAAVKLLGVEDRNASEALKERDVFIAEEDLRKLPEDTFYIRDLIGCRLVDRRQDKEIGEISDVIQNGPQDIYEIKLESGKKTYVPAVKEFIKKIDIDARIVEAELIPGFIENAIEA